MEILEKKIVTKEDYSLTGVNATRALELGLAEADWYQSPVPQDAMRNLLRRTNGPAIRDTIMLFTILAVTAAFTIIFWGTWWAVLPYLIYAVFYGTSSDSRWHECGHGTAFQSDWLNNVFYEIASFMVMRESYVWRWSHIRHHSDTIIVGRDPEIQVPRPPDLIGLVLSLVNLGVYKNYYPSVLRHAAGKLTDAEKTFIPSSEWRKVYNNARIVLGIYTLVIASAVILQSWIPVFLFILPQFFGSWLMIIHNTPQHAGLAENVLDHRLNCRTVYMNPISRFIYWNMNYHVEHHMFPLVPYHSLPRLHELIKDDCPPVYRTQYAAWKEIIPTLIKQVKDPAYHVKRKLPLSNKNNNTKVPLLAGVADAAGWMKVAEADILKNEDVIRFDHNAKTYAIYRDDNGNLYATDGLCTHGNTHLSEGLVKGTTIECPKHNGRFNLKDGSPARAPICKAITTYSVEERAGYIWLNIKKETDCDASCEKIYSLRVIENKNVSTFIKELTLEPVDGQKINFTPGDYIQIDIPTYDEISFSEFDIQEPYMQVWKQHDLLKLASINGEYGRRNNYSIASNPMKDQTIKLNVRIATPPPGQDCAPGVGSSFIFNLKPGDIVTASAPSGDFYIKPSQKEMIYIGGGAGMAPIRSHIAHLFENEATKRKVSYWYGARSKQEIFYDDYFQAIAESNAGFNFQIALSNPLLEDEWSGHNGFIHDVVYTNYLKNHSDIRSIEFYLCGPPMMIKACTKMLLELGANQDQIAFDEF
jgi:Na(+)-translocating NADH:ubiquinone oxidoreductase F subunit